MPTTTRATILVGLDNTPAARAALRWAVRHAGRTGAVVRAIHAFELPGTEAARLEPDLAGARQLVRDRAYAWVVDGLGGLDTGAPVIVEVRDGDAADVLSRAARTADMLVIGDNRERSSSPTGGQLARRCTVPPHCAVVLVGRHGRVHRLDRIDRAAS